MEDQNQEPWYMVVSSFPVTSPRPGLCGVAYAIFPTYAEALQYLSAHFKPGEAQIIEA